MNVYLYKAKKNAKETVTGHIRASSQDEAVEFISRLGLVPVSVVVDQNTAEMAFAKKGKVKSKELYVFSQQLATLLKSGVPILGALDIINRQISNKYFSEIIGDIINGVRNGRALSDCLLEYPDVFSSLYVTMVNVGENSSNLREMLLNITFYQRKQEEFFSKVRMAMVYPVLMGIVGILTVYFILSFVLPKMMGLFESIKGGLPLPTRIVLAVSSALTQYWYVSVVVVLMIVFAWRYFQDSSKGKMLKNRILFSLPFWGDLLQKSDLTRFCRTFHLLMKSGVSIVNAIKIAIPILNNEKLKQHLREGQEKLTAGSSLSDIFKETDTIPQMMSYMMSVGDESGDLNDVLLDIAEQYEQEVDEKIKIITTLLEPLMILAVGLVVGLIVFAILLPIFQIDVFSY